MLLMAGAAQASIASTSGFDVRVTDASVRIPKAGFTNTVAGMTIRVDRAAELIAASTPYAARTDLQTIRRSGDEVSMAPVPSIPLAPGADTLLRTGEGRQFLMLHRMKRALRPGDVVPMTLRIRSGGQIHSVALKARVVAPRSYSPMPEDDEH